MPVPQKQDVPHYRGDTLTMAVHLWEDAKKTQPCDLSAASVRAQIRKTETDPEVLDTFAVAITGNTVTLTLSADQTAALSSPALYDCEVDWKDDRTRVQTVVVGKISLKADVTHD